MSLADYLTGVVEILRADDGVTAACPAERIFRDELHREEADAMPRAAIVVADAGGSGQIGRAWQGFGDHRIDVFCYGEVPREAAGLYLAIHPVLKGLERTVAPSGVVIHWLREAGGPLPLRDPDSDWPYHFSSWQLLAADETAA